jgi:phosphate-selective porin OprO and OprP
MRTLQIGFLIFCATFLDSQHDVLASNSADALGARVEQQQRQIDELQKQVRELSAILANRIAKVEANTSDGKAVMSSPTARIESINGDFALQVVGAIQPTFAAYSQSNLGPRSPVLEGGSEFRRAHIGVQGTVYRDFGYTFVLDAAANGSISNAVRDATIQYSGVKPFTLTIGNQKPGGGLESSLSDRSNAQVFMEAALPTDLMNPQSARFIGARLSTGSDAFSTSLGVYGDDIANSGIALPIKDGWGIHGRATYAAINAPGRLLHIGASGFWRRPSLGRALAAEPVTAQLRFRARPEMAVDSQRLVDTGALPFARSFSTIGLESAAVWGPLSVQGELMTSRTTQSGGRQTLRFKGGYVAASYALTGESRIYDGRNGTFARFRPARNVDPSNDAWGAWELAARLSAIDLDSGINNLANGGVRGGHETNVTLGVNWHLSPFTRIMANYVRADAENLTATGLDEGTTADIFGFRVHQEW